MLGASMYASATSSGFAFYTRDITHYEQFLPESTLAGEVADAIYLYIGYEYDWDMELAIPAGRVPPVRLGRGAKLGWTSWMAPNWSKTDETHRKDGDAFHVVSRRARARAGH